MNVSQKYEMNFYIDEEVGSIILTIPVLFNNIISGKKLVKRQIDSRFHFGCKKHLKLDYSTGGELLCSSKAGNQIVVIENFYQLCSLMFMVQSFENLCFRY